MSFLLGILALSQLPPSLGWGPLFRSPQRLSNSAVSLAKPGRHGARLRLSHQHNDGHDSGRIHSVIPTNSSLIPTVDVTTQHTDLEYYLLEEENGLLRETIRQLELENERLKKSASRIVIENFEGEGKMPPDSFWFEGKSEPRQTDMEGITMTGEQMEASQLWCDELDDDACPVEPTISFGTS